MKSSPDDNSIQNPINVTTVPQWYLEAKQKGATKEQLYEMVRDFCRETLEWDARRKGQKKDTNPPELLVKVTSDMYEKATS